MCLTRSFYQTKQKDSFEYTGQACCGHAFVTAFLVFICRHGARIQFYHVLVLSNLFLVGLMGTYLTSIFMPGFLWCINPWKTTVTDRVGPQCVCLCLCVRGGRHGKDCRQLWQASKPLLNTMTWQYTICSWQETKDTNGFPSCEN